MREGRAELSEVFKRLDKGYKTTLSRDKRKVVESIINCRTSKLGAHVKSCNNCSYREQSYNSCRNRHCPKCQGSVAGQWTKSRNDELLPVEYFHSVFTLPQELRDICYQNKKLIYELMFQTISETLHTISSNPKFLGADIGFITVLHTWNQQLDYHPHIHVISPKGGISKNQKEWINPRGNFFLPVKALSKVYQGKFMEGIRKLYKQKKLRFFNQLSKLYNPNEFEKRLATAISTPWVVYSKKSFGGPTQVVKYLSSYVHRIAISNHRIKEVKDQEVTFSYRDSRNQNKRRLKTLPINKFSQKFLKHLLPKNFTRIRHYGFLGTATKGKKLKLAETLITTQKTASTPKKTKKSKVLPYKIPCPTCKLGELKVIEITMIPHRNMVKLPNSRCFDPIAPPDKPLAA